MPEPLRPRGGHLWTTAEVARVFHVGVSSIKRWTDEGELEAVRTPGGHRRYALTAIHRFALIRALDVQLLPGLDESESAEETFCPSDVTLYDALVGGDYDAVRQLITPHVDSPGQRAAFLDRVVGDALREVGFRYRSREVGIDEEHRAAHMLAEATERMRPRTSREAPLAILACPPGEQHELPLHLVRLVLEWSGWRTEFMGADLPWSGARAAIERASPPLLAFSARSSGPFQEIGFESLLAQARTCGTAVITGGEWARGGSGEHGDYLRFRTLRGFEKWLRTLPATLRQPVRRA